MLMGISRQEYLATIQSRLRDNPIVALPGPRQVGKTTLARMLAEAMPDQVIHHFDLESHADLARLSNPELALSQLRGLIILDEIQRMPELYPVLRVLTDRPELPARFLVLGSASSDMVQGASETLAGRISFIDITGFSLLEVGTEHLARHWWRGGFPRAYLARNEMEKRQWHEDFFRTFLERDIPQLGIRIPANTLRRFWTMLAHHHGQILQVSELARSLGTSEPTARRYLDILCGTYVVRLLPRWFVNLKKRQVKTQKRLHPRFRNPARSARHSLRGGPAIPSQTWSFMGRLCIGTNPLCDRRSECIFLGHSWRRRVGLARFPSGETSRVRVQIQRKTHHFKIDACRDCRSEFGSSLHRASRQT